MLAFKFQREEANIFKTVLTNLVILIQLEHTEQLNGNFCA